ncbi:BatA domain-containing protein [Thermopirellula anaerolimosa]
MAFVTPLFLWIGTALVGIPLVLHLVMRRQSRRVTFPALRFVRNRFQVVRRRLRLRHWILLILRMALLFFLCVLLARPSLRPSGIGTGEESPVAAALVFDTAPRMTYRQRNQTRLEAAREIADWLLTQLPRDSEIAVVDTGTSAAAFAVDRAAARTQIARLPISLRPASLPETLVKAQELLKTSTLERREIYVFSDLAAAAWPEDQISQVKRIFEGEAKTGVYFVDVGVPQPEDSAISGLRLNREVTAGGNPVELEVECRRFGSPVSQTVAVFLRSPGSNPTAEESLVKRSQRTVDLQADGIASLSFSLGNLSPGIHQGFVALEGETPLPANDRAYFTVEVRGAVPILIAAPPPAERHALYLSQALAPEAFRRAGTATFDCRVIDHNELPATDFGDCAAIILLDPPKLPDPVWDKIEDAVRSGKGLAIFLGRRASPAEAWNTASLQRILPARPLIQSRAPAGDVYLAPRDYSHYLLSPFRSLASSIPWDLFPVYRYWLTEIDSQSAFVVAEFSDGRAAILEKTLGRGRVILAATPISDLPDETPWNLLPVGQAWPFVILANQLGMYLSGAADIRLNYLPNEVVEAPTGGRDAASTFLLERPADIFAPSPAPEPPVRLQPNPATGRVVVPSTDRVGNYRLRAGVGESAYDWGFSVNFSSQAADLTRLPDERFREWFSPTGARLARTRQQLTREVSVGRSGYDLVPYLALLFVMIFAAEQVLANRFYGDRK